MEKQRIFFTGALLFFVIILAACSSDSSSSSSDKGIPPASDSDATVLSDSDQTVIVDDSKDQDDGWDISAKDSDMTVIEDDESLSESDTTATTDMDEITEDRDLNSDADTSINPNPGECTSDWQIKHPEWIFCENFEVDSVEALKTKGWYDINDKEGALLSITDEMAVRGSRSLKNNYSTGDTGGWMRLPLSDVPEIYVRYYRFFPDGWDWPSGYGPHESYLFAAQNKTTPPTQMNLTVYTDLYNTLETMVRVETHGQNGWGNRWRDVLRKLTGGDGNKLLLYH